MKLQYDKMRLDGAEPVDRAAVIRSLNNLGVRIVFEDAPRMASSDEHYESLDHWGRRLMATARKMRDDPGWNPE